MRSFNFVYKDNIICINRWKSPPKNKPQLLLGLNLQQPQIQKDCFDTVLCLQVKLKLAAILKCEYFIFIANYALFICTYK